MLEIHKDIPLADYNTFKIGGPARFFCIVRSEEDVIEAVNFAKKNELTIFVIGKGSNLLISDSGFAGLVVKNEIKGMQWTDSGEFVEIKAGAGEDWESLVEAAVSRGLYGVENLSAIPGTVGASVVQNIGAYGVDVSNVVKSVRVFDADTRAFVTLGTDDCAFHYRDSVFKSMKGRYIVTKVTYKLMKHGTVDMSYKDVKEYFVKKGISDPGVSAVRKAVVEIRGIKLPDWKKWGTAGSFFKNPVISAEKFRELKEKYAGLPGFEEPDGRIKVSLAWILDKVCGAKGLAAGNVSIYEKQPLVFVAKPGAKATEVIDLANTMMKLVNEKTGIRIESEVEWAVA